MAKSTKKPEAASAEKSAPKVEKPDPFHDAIKKYLDQRAADDELFAATYAKPNKNVKDCCTYIINEVKRMGVQGLPNEDVYNLAVHYYDEDNLKAGTRPSCTVVVDQAVELSEAEKAKAREKAMELAANELKEDAKKELHGTFKLSAEDIAEVKKQAMETAISEAKEKAFKKKTPAKKETVTQESLF